MKKKTLNLAIAMYVKGSRGGSRGEKGAEGVREAGEEGTGGGRRGDGKREKQEEIT